VQQQKMNKNKKQKKSSGTLVPESLVVMSHSIKI